MTHSSTGPNPKLQSPLSMSEVLRIPVMQRLWYAQLISVFGDFIALFAVISIMTFSLHATAQQITGIQIAYMFPIAALGMLGGVFVDRWPVKPTLVSSDAIRAALVVLLIFASQAWHFYVITAVLGIVSSFFTPAQSVAIRAAVPLHGMRSASALMQQPMVGMRILGPAVAALLVTYLGAASCYVLDSLSFIGSACLIASAAILKRDTRSTVATEERTSVGDSVLNKIWKDINQGVSFIRRTSVLLFAILAMAAAMLIIGCYVPLIAIYVRDFLHASTKMFGIVSPMFGAGTLLGINGLNIFGKRINNTALIYLGLGGSAIGLVILTLLPSVWLALVGNFLIGIAIAAIIVPAETLFQQSTPPELIGRVGSAFRSIIFSAQILGLTLSGVLAQHIGVREVFALCGGMLFILMAVGRVWMEPETVAQESSV